MRLAFVFALAFLPAAAFAAGKAGDSKVSILPGGDSKSPISIEADRLDYFEKEGKAVYDGHVVVVQGETKLTCAKLTIFFDKPGEAVKTETPKTEAPKTEAPKTEAPKTEAPKTEPAGDASNRLKHMDCAGPVSVNSKTQTATGDNGTYDKGRGNVVLTGHVVLTDGRNVTKGEKLVYDLASGQAAVQGGGSRVQGLFLPGSGDPTSAGKKK